MSLKKNIMMGINRKPYELPNNLSFLLLNFIRGELIIQLLVLRDRLQDTLESRNIVISPLSISICREEQTCGIWWYLPEDAMERICILNIPKLADTLHCQSRIYCQLQIPIKCVRTGASTTNFHYCSNFIMRTMQLSS